MPRSPRGSASAAARGAQLHARTTLRTDTSARAVCPSPHLHAGACVRSSSATAESPRRSASAIAVLPLADACAPAAAQPLYTQGVSSRPRARLAARFAGRGRTREGSAPAASSVLTTSACPAAAISGVMLRTMAALSRPSARGAAGARGAGRGGGRARPRLARPRPRPPRAAPPRSAGAAPSLEPLHALEPLQSTRWSRYRARGHAQAPRDARRGRGRPGGAGRAAWRLGVETTVGSTVGRTVGRGGYRGVPVLRRVVER